MKSFKEHLSESTVNTVIGMSEKQFDELLDTLSIEEMTEIEEGILGAIGKGLKKVGSAAVSGVKKVANRVSTSGRADAAQNKLAKIQKKKSDQQRLAKAKSDIKQAKSEEVKEEVVVERKLNIVETINSIVTEHAVLAGDGHSQNPTGDGTDLSLNDIKNAEILKQLNAHVGMIGVREYVNPKGALLQLQGKLATIGLEFDIPAMSEDKGTEKMPLKQYHNTN